MPGPDDHKLDHYLAYLIDPWKLHFRVTLKGQFDKKFQKATVTRFIRFLNPVIKNNEGKKNHHAHLNWYRIHTKELAQRKVAVRNQFGLQLLTLLRPVGLLVPAEKIEPNSQFPKELDHYKVYNAIPDKLILRKVLLEDQFDKVETVVEQAVYFAVPVEKRHEKRHFRIHNKEDHLVFYSIVPKEFTRTHEVQSQFGPHQMTTIENELLGVPTFKLDWANVDAAT